MCHLEYIKAILNVLKKYIFFFFFLPLLESKKQILLTRPFLIFTVYDKHELEVTAYKDIGPITSKSMIHALQSFSKEHFSTRMALQAWRTAWTPELYQPT